LGHLGLSRDTFALTCTLLYMLFSARFMFIHSRYKPSVTRYMLVTGRHFSSHFMKGVSIKAVVWELNSPKTWF